MFKTALRKLGRFERGGANFGRISAKVAPYALGGHIFHFWQPPPANPSGRGAGRLIGPGAEIFRNASATQAGGSCRNDFPFLRHPPRLPRDSLRINFSPDPPPASCPPACRPLESNFLATHPRFEAPRRRPRPTPFDSGGSNLWPPPVSRPLAFSRK